MTPINTAVSGSNAPIMEVEVEPMRFKAIVIRQRERTVGTIASCKACNSWAVFSSLCIGFPERKKFAANAVRQQKKRT